MPQVIYTGENYQQPIRSDGRALQAMSQFAQQHQMRQEADLQRARQDRDMLARYMQMDPVYATSVALQNKIAEELDTFNDNMLAINKETEGRAPTTTDLNKMQQYRSMTMAKMLQWKATDTELQQAQSMYTREPWKYDETEFKRGVEYTQKTGVMPVGGYLQPVVKDPRLEYRAFANEHVKSTGGAEWKEGKFVASPDGGGYYPETLVYKGESQFPEPVVQDAFLNAPMGQYNTQLWFDRESPSIREPWLKAANGNPATAAEMWLRAETKGTTYIPDSKKNWQRPVVSDQAPIDKYDEDWYIKPDGSVFYKGKLSFSPEIVKGSMLTDEGRGLSFAPDAPTIAVPVENLQFSATDIEFPKGSVVEVQPQIAKNGKIEYSVDPNRNGEVYVIVKTLDEVPLDAEDIPVPGGYKYKTKIGKNVTAVGNVSDVAGRLNTAYGQKFISSYENLFGPIPAATPPSKKGSVVDKILNFGKGLFAPTESTVVEDEDFEQYKR